MTIRLEDILQWSRAGSTRTGLASLATQLQHLFGSPDWRISDAEIIDGVGLRLVILFRSIFLCDLQRSADGDGLFSPCDIFGVVPFVCTVLCKDNITYGAAIEHGGASLFIAGSDYKCLASSLRAFFQYWTRLRDMLVNVVQSHPASPWQSVDIWREFLIGESGLATMPWFSAGSLSQRERALNQIVEACRALVYSILDPQSLDNDVVRLLIEWLGELNPRAVLSSTQNDSVEVIV